jgi:hypothetical protein
MTVRVLVTGSRQLPEPDRMIVFNALLEAHLTITDVGETMIVVHGDATGVDTEAARVARELRCEVEAHPAHWRMDGKRAGVMRSLRMVAAGASLCLAFPRRLSVGTWHCIRAASSAEIPTRIYPLPEIPR